MESIESTHEQIRNITKKITKRTKLLGQLISQTIQFKQSKSQKNSKFKLQSSIEGSLSILKGISKIINVRIGEQEQFLSDLQILKEQRKESREPQVQKRSLEIDKDQIKEPNFFDKFELKYDRLTLPQPNPDLARKEPRLQLYFRCNEHPQRILTGIAGLRNHMNTHQEKEFLICPNCKKGFSNCADLATHLKEEHPVKGRCYQCPFTNQQIANHSMLSNHVSRTRGYYFRNDIFVEESEAVRLIDEYNMEKQRRRNEKFRGFDYTDFQDSVLMQNQ